MTLGYPTSIMFLGLKSQRSRLGLTAIPYGFKLYEYLLLSLSLSLSPSLVVAVIINDRQKKNKPSSFDDNDIGISQLRTTVVIFPSTACHSQQAARYKQPHIYTRQPIPHYIYHTGYLLTWSELQI